MGCLSNLRQAHRLFLFISEVRSQGKRKAIEENHISTQFSNTEWQLENKLFLTNKEGFSDLIWPKKNWFYLTKWPMNFSKKWIRREEINRPYHSFDRHSEGYAKRKEFVVFICWSYVKSFPLNANSEKCMNCESNWRYRAKDYADQIIGTINPLQKLPGGVLKCFTYLCVIFSREFSVTITKKYVQKLKTIPRSFQRSLVPKNWSV